MRDRFLVLIVCIAFLIRLFSFVFTAIVNPDGVIYIHQARAIYYGLWDSILNCGIGYLSNYSVLIAGLYPIVRNWLLAAKLISLAFGTLTVVPLCLLLSGFFRKQIALLGGLVYALIPVFVDKSVDVVRDPVYWFFLVFGLYFFTAQIGKTNRLYLIVSCLCFLMAAWARIEALLCILVSFLFILFTKEERRIEKLSLFPLPVVVIVLSSVLGLMIFHTSGADLYRIEEIMSRVSAPMGGYSNVRAGLAELMSQPLDNTLAGFIHRARNLVWLVALGTMVKYAITAFFYPFFLLFIIGLKGIRTSIKGDRRVLYLSLLSISALFLLYVQVLQTWMIYNRLFAIVILPSFIFIGFGLEKTVGFLGSRLHLRDSLVLIIVSLLVLASSLPEDLKPRETDKLVFKEIGVLIAEREGNEKEIKVVTSLPLIRWISFYANLGYRGAPCPEKNYDLVDSLNRGYDTFVGGLKDRGIQYILWDERHWPKGSLESIRKGSGDFIRLGDWHHQDTGKMILFKVL